MTQADPNLLLDDIKGVLPFVTAAFHVAKGRRLDAMPGWNPNDPSVAARNGEGVNVIPISVHNGKRAGARERVLQAQRLLQGQAEQGQKVGRLDLALNTFATNVVFADDDPTRAIGVRCVPGPDLYAARHHGKPGGQAGQPIVYKAGKEVILCGGAFNTPQLLMLSGIGPQAELARHGIATRIDLPGVGRNLQDRYEVGVVARSSAPFRLLRDAAFKARARPGDPDPGPGVHRVARGGSRHLRHQRRGPGHRDAQLDAQAQRSAGPVSVRGAGAVSRATRSGTPGPASSPRTGSPGAC